MRKLNFLAALAAVCLLGTAVHAADLPKKAVAMAPAMEPVYSWTGLYGEIYGLYGANMTNLQNATIQGVSLGDLAASPHGPGIGGAIGYNWDFGNVVFGPRVDLAYTNFQGGGTLAQQLSFSNATNYLGDVDLLLGLKLSPDGRFLGYINGGFAFGGAKPNLSVVGLAPQQIQAAARDTSTGFNIGVGLKYAVTPNWSLGVEGDFYKLGDKSLTATIGGLPVVTATAPYNIFVQKFVLSYKF